jgi:hypothetical protein
LGYAEADLPLAERREAFHFSRFNLSLSDMIAPETFNHIENIKKRAGHLWRFL